MICVLIRIDFFFPLIIYDARKELFLAYPSTQRAFVNDEYKHIICHINRKTTEQLFNLLQDPLEMHNLLPENREVADKLKTQWAFSMKEEDDFFDPDVPPVMARRP